MTRSPWRPATRSSPPISIRSVPTSVACGIRSRAANAQRSPNDLVISYEATLLRVGIRGDPGIGQEFAEPSGGMGRQPLQDVFEVSVRIDAVTLAAPHQAIQRRRRPAASV